MIELKPDAHYEALNAARDLRFSGHGPCISKMTGEVVMPAPESINLCWIQSTTPRGAGRKRTKGLSGPHGLCAKTGAVHRTGPHGRDKCGTPRIRCKDCWATWGVARHWMPLKRLDAAQSGSRSKSVTARSPQSA